VVVNVGDGLMGFALVLFRAVLVPVNETGVVVLVHVVVGAVREFAHRAAGVLVRDVPVIVRVDLCGMSMLVGLVAYDLLLRLDGHVWASLYDIDAPVR